MLIACMQAHTHAHAHKQASTHAHIIMHTQTHTHTPLTDITQGMFAFIRTRSLSLTHSHTHRWSIKTSVPTREYVTWFPTRQRISTSSQTSITERHTLSELLTSHPTIETTAPYAWPSSGTTSIYNRSKAKPMKPHPLLSSSRTTERIAKKLLKLASKHTPSMNMQNHLSTILH